MSARNGVFGPPVGGFTSVNRRSSWSASTVGSSEYHEPATAAARTRVSGSSRTSGRVSGTTSGAGITGVDFGISTLQLATAKATRSHTQRRTMVIPPDRAGRASQHRANHAPRGPEMLVDR